MLDSVPAASVVVDGAGIVVAANRRAAEFFGHNPAAAIGHPVDGVFRTCLQRAERMVAAGAEPAFEQYFDGTWYMVLVFPLGTSGLRWVAATEISKRKAEEFEIRENEARLEEATRIAQLGTFKLMWDGGAIQWSPHMYILHDVSTETYTPGAGGYLNLIHPDDRDLVRRIAADATSGRPLSGAEYRILHRDGSVRWIRIDGRVLFDAEGAPCGTFGICQDITDTKNREQELNDLLRRNATLYEALEASPIGVAVLTPDGDGPVFFYLNAEFQRLTLHNGFSLRGKSLEMLRPAGDTSQGWRATLDALDASASGSFELACARRDGTTFLAQIEIAPVRDFPGRDAIAYVVNLRDITVDKQRAETLLQSQKMEALGQLSGGVAHEINNLLQPVIALSELGGAVAGTDADKVRRYFDVIGASGRKARDVVRQVLTFARRDPVQVASHPVAPLMADALDLVVNALPPGIAVSRALLSGERRALVNPTQVSQIVLNLVKNAADAMSGRGEVAVSLVPIVLDEPSAAALNLAPGAWLKLTVADKGCGMSRETRARIFEPFFTTKPVGKGTGLGLSVVYSIVAGWGGTVRIESEVDKGTNAMVYIPVDSAPA
jgi:signal transduction histidine kinase